MVCMVKAAAAAAAVQHNMEHGLMMVPVPVVVVALPVVVAARVVLVVKQVLHLLEYF